MKINSVKKDCILANVAYSKDAGMAIISLTTDHSVVTVLYRGFDFDHLQQNYNEVASCFDQNAMIMWNATSDKKVTSIKIRVIDASEISRGGEYLVYTGNEVQRIRARSNVANNDYELIDTKDSKPVDLQKGTRILDVWSAKDIPLAITKHIVALYDKYAN